MAQSKKFVYGGVALLLISTSGCAGSGIRNMFSRNETAGYKTLEEVEAEKDEQESSLAESKGPRFAPWLPFGKKSAEETEIVAATDPDVAESEKETASKSWWKNPFRRQETVESDPFLTVEESSESVASKAKSEAGSAPAVAGLEAKATKPQQGPMGKNVKAVSSTTETVPTEDDELLVSKFEKNFQRETIEAAEGVEGAAPLIVAGKQTTAAAKNKAAKTADDVDSAADEKLQEFERLLSEKKTAAKQVHKETILTDEAASFEDTAEDFTAIMKDQQKSTRKTALGAKDQAGRAVDSFDNLLDESAEPAVARKSKSASRRPTTSKSKVTEDVNVADAEDLFGAQPGSGDTDSDRKTAQAKNGGWSSTSEVEKDLGWDKAKKSNPSQRADIAKKVIGSTVDQFAAMFAAARTAEPAPAATAPDTPESDAWSPSPQPGGQSRAGAPIRMASSGRSLLSAPEKPAGLTQDSFFTDVASTTTSAQQQVAEQLVAPTASPAVVVPSSGFRLRNVLLLIGGLIVVALLFAPGRKKSLQANQLPVQG